MTDLYVAEHESQYGVDRSKRTRKSGCTWTGASTGVDAQSGGAVDPEPDAILALVRPSEEENPLTPGWSLRDVDLAMTRMTPPVPFELRSGWTNLVAARDRNLYVLLPGDSDRFGDADCSGAFDGLHLIGVPPGVDGPGQWGINDPICPRLTYQSPATIRAYAAKRDSTVPFGVFTNPVPFKEDISVPGLRFRYLSPATGTATIAGSGHSIIRVFDGGRVNVPAGQVRETFGRAELFEPLDAGAGDRRTGYLIGPIVGQEDHEAAFVLASDVKYAPTPIDCSAIQSQLDAANARIRRAITDLGGTLP